jgi:hypothetical protein
MGQGDAGLMQDLDRHGRAHGPGRDRDGRAGWCCSVRSSRSTTISG